MRIKTLQWNIGGGFIRKPEADPMDPLSYEHESLGAFIDILKELEPDIITIQESHSDKDEDQLRDIARALDMPFTAGDVYCKSHLVEGKGLGQGIISRFPISGHHFENFYNPKARGKGPRGENWISDPKGVTSCMIKLDETGEAGGTALNVKTSHSFPYRRFKLDPMSPAMEPLRRDMTLKMTPDPGADAYLYQGDINYNEYSAKPLLPDLFVDGMDEVLLDKPTTPKGRKYDHVFFRGLKHVRSEVITDVPADHFPVLTEFEV